MRVSHTQLLIADECEEEEKKYRAIIAAFLLVVAHRASQVEASDQRGGISVSDFEIQNMLATATAAEPVSPPTSEAQSISKMEGDLQTVCQRPRLLLPPTQLHHLRMGRFAPFSMRLPGQRPLDF